MLYMVSADIVVFVHFIWTLFLVIGILWGARNKVVRIIHLCGLAYAGITVPFDYPCPLTNMELWLHSRHDPSLNYAGHFIIHYTSKILHIQLHFYFIEISTILLCLFNFWLYFGKGALPLRRRLSGTH